MSMSIDPCRWLTAPDSGADRADGVGSATALCINVPAAAAAARQGGTMSKLRCDISISLDGFVAGPDQREVTALGEGRERLHDWVVPLAAWSQAHGKQGGEVNESARIVEESRENVSAWLMGSNMFGPVGDGAWGDGQWR